MGKKKRKQQLTPSHQQANESLTGTWIHIVRALLASAMAITAYLAFVSLSSEGATPGCGPDSGCDQVLTSPWAYWLGIPVSLPGLALYGVFLLSTFSLKLNHLGKARRSLNAQTVCAFSVLAAAIWFVGVQAFKIRAFCPYCCTAHLLASVASILFLAKANFIGSKLSVSLNFTRGAAAGVGLAAAIALTQTLFPKEQNAPEIVDLAATPALEGKQTETPAAVIQNASIPDEPIGSIQPADLSQSTIAKRIFSKPLLIPRSNFKMETNGLPTLGDLDAPHRIACIFDYTCHHCRNLHGFIRQLLVKYKGQFSSLMIPMPLDAKCNRLMKKTPKDHQNACEYAKLCLAVHHVAPEKYDAFDSWLFSNHRSVKTVATVMKHAQQLVGAEKLKEALQSSTLKKQLESNITAYETTSKTGRKSSMPQTIIGSQVVFGPPPNVEALDKILRQILKLK